MKSKMAICVGCKKKTTYRCPFCLVYDHLSIYICENPECREKHESIGCVRTREKSHGS
jgi:hypothetical protein